MSNPDRMTARQISNTIGALAAAYIITPPRRSTTLISEMGQAYGNVMRAALGTPPYDPPAPARPPWTIAGAREHLYETHRERWIETGDLEQLDLMVRHVRP